MGNPSLVFRPTVWYTATNRKSTALSGQPWQRGEPRFSFWPSATMPYRLACGSRTTPQPRTFPTHLQLGRHCRRTKPQSKHPANDASNMRTTYMAGTTVLLQQPSVHTPLTVFLARVVASAHLLSVPETDSSVVILVFLVTISLVVSVLLAVVLPPVVRTVTSNLPDKPEP